MGEFFNENCSKFEQDFDNYQKQGETLEQVSCGLRRGRVG